MMRSLWFDPAGQLHRDLPIERFTELRDAREGLLWVDLGACPPEEVVRVTTAFRFHPLAIEDCLHLGQFPKLDDYGDHLFLVAHGPEAMDETSEFATRELEMFLGRAFLVTHHAEAIPAINALFAACERDSAHHMGRGPAVLAHLILDHMVDGYRPVLEKLDERLEQVEDEVVHSPGRRTQIRISRLKKDLLRVRRVAGPERDVVNRLARDPHPLIPADVRPYFRDVYDHLTRVVEETEIDRDLIAGLRDTYLATISNRTNEVVKTLTIVATALLPVNILAGIYGMNFEHMPFKDAPWGFYAMLTVMAAVAGVTMFLFKRARWW